MINLYNKKIDDDDFDCRDQELALQILNPDYLGKTALWHANNNQSPKSFELMMNFLRSVNNRPITKMFIDLLPTIISYNTPDVQGYFDDAIYQLPQMEIPYFLPWGSDMEEFVFLSHTSIIYKDLLLNKLSEHGIE
jgi:hypothetical protein